MAYKRKISVKQDNRPAEEGVDGFEDDKDVPVRDRVDRGWWHWATHEYARYWYVIGAIALDSFWFLEAYGRDLASLTGTVMVIVLIGLVLLEIWGYTRLWKKV